MQTSNETESNVIIGKITGVYGIKGWVKVLSYTRPKQNIQQYPNWLLLHDGEQIEIAVMECKSHGKGIIAKLDGIEDRDDAIKLQQADITIHRSELPELADGEYYWHDLMGLSVIDQNNVNLGKVIDIVETGANDVFVVSGNKRRLIPWVMDIYIKEINIGSKEIRVDWLDEED